MQRIQELNSQMKRGPSTVIDFELKLSFGNNYSYHGDISVDQFYIYPPKGVNNAKMEIECDVVACSVVSEI